MQKLFEIPELLVMLYKNLTFHDQLRFAQVNSSLRSIFANLIVPLKYRKIALRKYEEVNEFFVSNEKYEDCMLLTYDEVKNFFKFGADKVEVLHVISKYEHFDYSLTSFGISWLNLQNLTCLHYVNLLLSGDDLLVIAANCPELRELRLIDCLMELEKPVVVGQDISVTTLEQMKHLKCLVIKNYFDATTIHMNLFCDLITKMPMECLKIYAELKQDVSDNLSDKTFYYHLKKLNVSLNSESLAILERKGIFKNLLKLHLNDLDNLTDYELQTIAKACENLECLKFGYDINFENIKKFLIPPHLKQLYFSHCLGLRQEHLNDALNKSKIDKLVHNCCYIRRPLLEDFTISAHIQILDLEYISALPPSSYVNNTSLRELHWYEYDENIPDEMQSRKCLKTCKNLEKLFIHSGYIPLDVILDLKHLQNLKIHQGAVQLNWSYVTGLLKHPCLREFYLSDYNEPLEDDTNIPTKGFPSTITIVHLRFELLYLAFDFWLDMLQHNPTMSIKSNIMSNFDLSFLMELIQHKNFPKDLRELKVWGFNLSCKDLRENFLATIRPLEEVITRKDYEYQTDTLVLSRKKALK